MHTGQPVMRTASSRTVQSYDGHIPPSALAASSLYKSSSIDDPVVRRVVDDLFFSLRVTVNDLEVFHKVYESKCFLKAYISFEKLKASYLKRTALSCSIILSLHDREDMFHHQVVAKYVYRPDQH